MKVSLYLGCALTHASPEFIAAINRLKAALRPHYDVLEFLGLEGGTNKDVYNHDIKNCVGGCRVFVPMVDLPSIGLGYEAATAVEKLGTPTLALAHVDSKVTRLIMGVDHPCFRFGRYQNKDMTDVPALIHQFVKEIVVPTFPNRWHSA